jgi:TPR repeat protein
MAEVFQKIRKEQHIISNLPLIKEIRFAPFNLAICRMKDEGVSTDMKEALCYFKLAVNQGNADAQFEYGLSLQNGEGVSPDLKARAYYFKLAADQGFVNAQL